MTVEIALWVLFYASLYTDFIPFFTQTFLWAHRFGESDGVLWRMNWVSCVHAAMGVPRALWLVTDRLWSHGWWWWCFGTSACSSDIDEVAAQVLGYHIVELFLELYHRKIFGAQMILHGSICLSFYSAIAAFDCMPNLNGLGGLGCMYFVWEISTLPISLRYQLQILRKWPHIQIHCDKLFYVLFTAFRIVLGIPLVISSSLCGYWHSDKIPFIILLHIGAAWLITGLNVLWWLNATKRIASGWEPALRDLLVALHLPYPTMD